MAVCICDAAEFINTVNIMVSFIPTHHCIEDHLYAQVCGVLLQTYTDLGCTL